MEPRDYQRIALRALESTRKRGETSALVVMASSLGKTIVAALDVMKFLTDCNGKCVLDSGGNNNTDDDKRYGTKHRKKGKRKGKKKKKKSKQESWQDGGSGDCIRKSRVLCLCHGNAILEQNLDKFKQILGEQYSYGLFNSYEKNYTADIVFASFQSILIHQDLFQEDDFDYIVVDEAHHAPARTYRKAIEFFKPKFLLGVTATPDRMDGKKLEDIFGPIIYDLDLVEAMKLGLLVKVDYHVLLDELVNLGSIIATGEKISATELNRRLFVPKRDEEIINIIQDKVTTYSGNSVIIFCRSIEHAERINALLPDSRLVHSSMNEEVWQQNLADFKDGKAKYIVSVDQLNEGIDIPRADILVFLRSTVSQIVYYQQLGRGLRTHEGKDKVVVLDFVASHERLKTIATLQGNIQSTGDGKTRDYFDLNIEATQFREQKVDIFSVLETIKRLTRTYTKEELVSQVQMLTDELGRTPTSREFDDDSRVVGRNVIARRFGSWNEFLEVAGLEVNLKVGYTKEELIGQLLMLAGELGRAPTGKEFDNDSRTASVGVVARRFDSWNEFLEAAGLGANRMRYYTKEELIGQLLMLADELRRTPTSIEFSEDPRTASVAVVARRFGSWNEFLEVAGLEVNLKKNYTKEDLIEQLLMLAEELERTPTRREFDNDSRTASISVVARRFGSWNEFLEAAGLGDNRMKYYTKEELIGQLLMLAEELRRTPTSIEFSEDPRTASVGVVARRFGSWNEFLKAAKLKVAKSSPRRFTKEQLIAQAQILAGKLGRTPTKREFECSLGIGQSAAVTLFGSWNQFLEDAGLTVNKRSNYTKAELIAQALMLTKELGRVPRSKEFDRDQRVASVAVARRLFGSWNGLIEAAGLKPNRVYKS